MDYATFVSQIVGYLLAKSGVREWEQPDVRTAIIASAIEMADALFLSQVEPGVSMPTAFYHKTGTQIIFGSQVGDDIAWSSESIANAAGRQSSFRDQGADGTARAHHWRYRFYTQLQATPTVGNVVDLRLRTSDGTHPDNDDGTSDAAVSSINKLLNLAPLAPVIVDEAAANIEMVSHGSVFIPERYFGVVLWNTSGATITADDTETKAVFTPYFLESQ